jgi:hypothetical protein
VACPAGKTVVSGGFDLDGADVEQSEADTELPGWRVTARGGATGGSFAPIVLCGKPA